MLKKSFFFVIAAAIVTSELGLPTASAAPLTHNGNISYVSLRHSALDREIYTINPDGTHESRTSHYPDNDFAPSYSPDGTKIVFYSARDGVNEIYTMNADGTNQVRLTTNGPNASPQYSPDGTKIVYNRTVPTNNSEIYVMNADGTNQTRLTNVAGNDAWATWSPDGTKILFQSTRNTNTELYTMNADGTNQVRLTTAANTSIHNYGSDYSPDGTKIVFSSNRNGSFDIFSMNADGTGATQLTAAAFSSISYAPIPRYSPDGTKIVYSMLVSPTLLQLFTMNADGTNEAQLTNSGFEESFPAWQPIAQPFVSTPVVPAGSPILSYTNVGVHPQAILQPSALGKRLRKLSVIDDKLYIGYGDGVENHGPVDVNPYNLLTHSFEGSKVSVGTELLGVYRKINGVIYTPMLDPLLSNPAGYASGTSNGPWSVSTPITAVHVIDVATYTGTDVWFFGAQSTAARIWRSQDGGSTWPTALNETLGSFNNRFYWGAMINGKMYVQASAPTSTVKSYDGTSWTAGTASRVTYTGETPVVLNNQIISKLNGLSVFDGTTVSRVSSFQGWASELFVDNGYLYVLREDDTLVRSADLVSWQELGRVPSDTVTVAAYNDRVYIGAENAVLYESDSITAALARASSAGILAPTGDSFQTTAIAGASLTLLGLLLAMRRIAR